VVRPGHPETALARAHDQGDESARSRILSRPDEPIDPQLAAVLGGAEHDGLGLIYSAAQRGCYWLAGVGHVPGSLDQALDALEADHAFLLKGDVFSEDLTETWIA
jgi:hypothetical protein